MNGILVVDKPAGWTSFDVVAKLRRLAGERRIGHAGTLDPPATGVLVVCLGNATRLVEFIAEGVKQYRGVVRFGSATDTDDATGATIAGGDPAGLARETIEAALPAFHGFIDQVPPRISAIKVSGQRAYALARAGQQVVLKPRPVRIDTISPVSYDPPDMTIDVTCGGGTYIRSLARDLGEAVGVPAHLASLVRTAVGAYRIADAVPLQQLIDAPELLGERLLAPASAVSGWPALHIDSVDEWRLRAGQSVAGTVDADRVAAFDDAGTLVAVLQRDGTQLRPRKVFARPVLP